MKRILIPILIAMALFVTGCETFHGFGRDVEKAGEWVQEKAS